jgi:iron complex outermembrane recepter protein
MSRDRGSRLFCGFRTASLVFFTVLASGVPAVVCHARAPMLRFDIKPGKVERVLSEFAAISGTQLAYDLKSLNDRQSPGVSGNFSSGQALSKLLSGTGLRAETLKSGVVKIDLAVKEAAPPVAPEAPPVPEASPEPETVIVRGVRASFQSGAAFKRNTAFLSDSVVAEDFGKLPDNNLSEALQRISGVQITRNHGEGSGIAIRGLTQVKTLINGREVYSDVGRDLSLEYLPAEVFAQLDVYKNPSATFIEGGIGGVVNLRTRMPFDFKGFEGSMSLRQNAYDLARKQAPDISALVSTRFATRYGEVGVMVGMADMKSAGRFDQIGVEPFNNRYNLLDYNNNGVFPGTSPPTVGSDAGDLVISPNGGGNSVELTERERKVINVVAQWRPNDAMALTLEAAHYGYEYVQSSYVVFANRGPLLALPGATFIFADDTNVVQAGAYRDVTFTSNSNYFDRTAFTDQVALSGSWRPDVNLKLFADIAYTNSLRLDHSGGIRIGNSANPTGTTLFFDVRGDEPSFTLKGFPVGDPSRYNLIDASHALEKAQGKGLAGSVNGTYTTNSGIFESIEFGLRHSVRTIDRRQGTRQHFPINSALSIDLLPQAASPISIRDFYREDAGSQLIGSGVLGAPLSLLRDIETVCAGVGDTVCYPAFNPLNTYSAEETTSAVFGQINYGFNAGPFPVTGNVGARYVTTKLHIAGFRTSNNGLGAPIDQQTRYNDFLPSFNARVALKPDLFLRLAAAKQLTRPSFSQLSPNLSIGFANANSTLTGVAGNPDLRPLRATAYDAALEYYFTRNGYTYLSLFRKEVSGFIQTVTTEEAVAFPDYPQFPTALITRPQNGNDGTIDGFEIGVQTFLDFLPTPFDNLGIQANYTRVNSTAPGPIAGTTVPLVGLSKNSYNLVGYYEKGKVRARLAYSYRDDYVETTSGPGSGALPIYASPVGYLAASLGYKVSPRIDISIDADNITNAEYGSYFGFKDRPRFHNIVDRRIGAVVRVTY